MLEYTDDANTDDLEDVAHTILLRMGGMNSLISNVGAKKFLMGRDEDGNPFLRFAHMTTQSEKIRTAVNYTVITLNPNNTYTMDFLTKSKRRVGRILHVTEMQLIEVWQSATGFVLMKSRGPVMAGKKERERAQAIKRNLKNVPKSELEKTDAQKITDHARWLKMKQEPGQSGAGGHRTKKDYNRNPKHKGKGDNE